ncbi:Asp-tRNA(Asn)/Glu-tRNA(Gln) amidotransferase GatCAB subunit A [candidate division WWE3 bacterium CG08_land_8_20_14_0_20_40_13]|uniref:Glutamyl-tRNA(Gln) amidotransferase subunit A n=1 Tax=candidate division WWE3 bacterium CG08_land_8_20_14_0_20_40_13 TaxID=1975084 RepID=A0A2H0XGB4_UNCKA|nr:MAG: Asp-tRNA(Asn)/Glu-tRNA(Gln) amidotransferase GatCAB subunit A [candidate division WWE3 bacterium CG08_land_8_20_14_0_20_40_13]
MNDLWNLNIVEALSGLNGYKFSSEDLVRSIFSRIDAVEPKVSSFISLFREDALSKACNADTERVKGSAKKLLGIPYSAKDMFNTKGYKTTAGSKVLENYIAPYESTATQRLNDEGAILIGKTNQDAFAHGSSTENSDFFVTKNPWDVTRLPGGSSGGSAASVIADEAVFSIGTETGGSIRHPASWCGCVGLKPSYGRVSRYGVISMCSSTDSPGPLTKTVQDAGHILNVIAGNDYKDATSSDDPIEDYAAIQLEFLKGKVIGVPKAFLNYQMEEGVKIAFKKALLDMEKLGAKIKEIDLMDPKYAVAVYTIVQRAEVSSNLARYDGVRYGNTRETFGNEAQRRILLGTYVLSTGYYDKYYQKAQKVRSLIHQDFDEAFKLVDMIVSPTSPSVALKIGAGADQAMFGEIMDAFSLPASLAGLCAISVPCGFSENLPVGIQFIGDRFEEKEIIDAAYSYEQLNKWYLKKPVI